MIGAPNSLNLNCKVRVMKEAPGPSVSEEIADIFTNYNINTVIHLHILYFNVQKLAGYNRKNKYTEIAY